jgi:hypothetical protein
LVAATRDILQQHLEEQATWPEVTDCDRLDAAFEALNCAGIIARQNFYCCRTCGVAAIVQEIQQFAQTGRTARGYTFYHMQDTENAVKGHGIYLAHGVREGTEQETISVAREIQETLQLNNLRTTWDGKPGTCISKAAQKYLAARRKPKKRPDLKFMVFTFEREDSLEEFLKAVAKVKGTKLFPPKNKKLQCKQE